MKNVKGIISAIIFTAAMAALPGMLYAGNVDVVLPGGSAFNIISGPTNLMTVKSGGKIGIGEINPLTRLDVKGFGNTSTTSSFSVRDSSAVSLFHVRDDGNVGIGTTSPTEILDVNSNSIRIRTAKTPATSGDACDVGEISWDTSYLYVCITTNQWARVAIGGSW